MSSHLQFASILVVQWEAVSHVSLEFVVHYGKKGNSVVYLSAYNVAQGVDHES